jgi:thioredoxin reductase
MPTPSTFGEDFRRYDDSRFSCRCLTNVPIRDRRSTDSFLGDIGVASFVQVAIVGAGPYGLSLAAHLAEAGANFRIFGKTMSTWRDHVPAGMTLKSDGFASNLSHPDRASTLAAYCAARGLEYDDRYIPVPLALFGEYSTWFQKTYVPMVEELNVARLAQKSGGFALTLENGEQFTAARVVLGAGLTHFRRYPEELKALLGPQVTHTFDHDRLAPLAGRDVLILGAGSSAVDTAVLAADAGAKVTLMARRPIIHYHEAPDPDAVSWLSAIAHPSSGIGPGWRSFFCTRAPRLFRRLPEDLRLRATRNHLGPAPGWFMRGKMEGKVRTLLGHHLVGAETAGGQISVIATDGRGARVTVRADQVICATGYKPDLRSLPFLDQGLRLKIAHVDHTPHLSDNFETSVPGLHAMGALAANTFGPLMRFMVGAEYVAPRLSAHLVRLGGKAKAAA